MEITLTLASDSFYSDINFKVFFSFLFCRKQLKAIRIILILEATVTVLELMVKRL